MDRLLGFVLRGEVVSQQQMDEAVAATNFAEQHKAGGVVEEVHVAPGGNIVADEEIAQEVMLKVRSSTKI